MPLEALKRVEARGRGRRTLRIVLASPHAGSGTVSVRCHSAPAVLVFAARATATVPVRDREEARTGGATRVTVEPVTGPVRLRMSRAARWGWAVIAVYAAVLPVLGFVKGWRSSLGLWAFAPLLLLPGGGMTWFAVSGARTRWIMRTRGITVVARHTHTDWGGEDESATCTYEYTDTAGTVREHRGEGPPRSDDGEHTEVTYDPRHPDRSYARGDQSLAEYVAYWVGGPLALLAGLYYAAGAVLA
ncbi:hypothetical protein ACQEVS_11820 [Streptomyces sp. CA-181903]|uniref:hypothetical protein n=1 Tax=Streptomyces sp. CA-181903 TaxID=3240055 RepID=UPI003D93E5ED